VEPPASAAAEPPIPVQAAPPPGKALVHLYADYPNATLELESLVDPDSWAPACIAPCDLVLLVDGKEARVVAPGMTPSNAFRIEGGSGVAQFRVAGGSATARTVGLIGLGTGIPVSLGGSALFGYGTFKEKDGIKTAGIVVMVVGALEIAAALPLLVAGATSVHDAKGSTIARALRGRAEF
jgi:hypothetical protein